MGQNVKLIPPASSVQTEKKMYHLFISLSNFEIKYIIEKYGNVLTFGLSMESAKLVSLKVLL